MGRAVLAAAVVAGLITGCGGGGDGAGAGVGGSRVPLRQQIIERLETTPEFTELKLTPAQTGCTADLMIKYIERGSIQQFLDGTLTADKLKPKPGADRAAMKRDGEKCSSTATIIDGG